jgi:hypothetical protein
MMADWQLIETAPKDGRYLIVAKFTGEALGWVSHSRWITADEICEIEGGAADEYDPGWTDGNRDDEPIYPTHWMPLERPTGAA